MSAVKTLKAVGAACLTAACVFAFTACSGSNNASGTVAGLTGGVAATVNGTDINEDDVTTYIENFRTRSNLTSEDDWGNWLSSQGYTPEAIRDDIVDYYVSQELLKQAAKENDITVDDATIDEYVNKVKANYSDDAAWADALKQANTNEGDYRKDLELALLEQKLQEKVAPAADPDDATMLQYAQMYASTYDGAKRSSHILFAAGDEATAQEVLDKINSGELDFADAAKQYSQDSSASNGGDVGWDKLNNFVTQYTDALDGLSKGQVSGLVTSDFGIHIIKCTDEFHAPETVTDINQLPAEFVTSIKSMLSSSSNSEAFSKWFETYKEGATIETNPMPDNLPYNVDMSKYPASDTSGTDASSSGTDPVVTEEGTPTDEGDGTAAPEATTDDGATGTEQPAEQQ